MPYLNNTTIESINTNDTLAYCQIPQYFQSFGEFFECYKYFAVVTLWQTIGQAILGFLMISLNAFVISLLLLKPDKTIFDKILTGHCKYLRLVIYFNLLFHSL